MSRTRFLAPLFALMLTVPAFGQLTFNFNDVTPGGAPQNVLDGFQEAADLWGDIFDDNITINVDINFSNLGSGVLGSTSNQRITDSYSNVRAALVADASSADDIVATNNLQLAPDLSFLINRTTESSAVYLDSNGSANNTTIRFSRSNAKALGILAGNDAATDGAISFNSAFTWDFDRSDGQTDPGAFDFIIVAAHEIGHLMGFTSGVDILDNNADQFPENAFTWVNTMDLYRFSDNSGFGTQMDWTADNREKYFSIDGGTTDLTIFSNGRVFGDGQQASHWKDNRGIGIMDPTAAPGEFNNISGFDIQAFDVIGYDLIAVVPEPGSAAVLFALSILAGVKRRRTRC